MANTNFPMGFVPVKYLSGRDLECEEAAMNPTHDAIYIHDLLERRTDGYVHVAQATTTTLIGVAAEYKAANATGNILYYPLEGLVMKAQMASFAQADAELAYDIVATTGDTTTHYSKHSIAAAGAGTATFPIKVLTLVEMKGKQTNVAGAYAKVLCMANQGATKGAGTAG